MTNLSLWYFIWIFYLVTITHSFSYSENNKATLLHPYFDESASSNVTIIIDNTAYLKCRIYNLGNKTVVWVRHRDIHLLTVNQLTYTSDERFNCVHSPDTNIWTLQIKKVRQNDSGIYECQVGITPAIGIPIFLTVVEPITTVLGGPELYINAGSTINLTCIVQNLPIPPSFVIWTHNNQEINFDSPRGGVSVITEKGDVTTSYLYIQRAKNSDNGEYKCSPSTANNVTVRVYILKGEQSAAIQQISNKSNSNYKGGLHLIAFFLLFVYLFSDQIQILN